MGQSYFSLGSLESPLRQRRGLPERQQLSDEPNGSVIRARGSLHLLA
jgi:hypothetical protein